MAVSSALENGNGTARATLKTVLRVRLISVQFNVRRLTPERFGENTTCGSHFMEVYAISVNCLICCLKLVYIFVKLKAYIRH